MKFRQWSPATLSVLCAAALTGVALAQAPDVRRDRNQLREPVYRNPGEQQQIASRPTGPVADQIAAPVAGQHPLVPAIEMATSAMKTVEANVKDYTATMYKQERVGGKLQDKESMFVKIRYPQATGTQQAVPFSVYLYFLSPASAKGREVIYIEGANNGKMIAHDVGLKGLMTVRLDPRGSLAMKGQLYPITEIGFLNLAKRLVEVAESDAKFPAETCSVKIFPGAKIGSRPCTGIQVMHEQPSKDFRFYKAEVFVDKEMNIPVHYASYDWPSSPGAKPELLESYTYSDVKINVGLTDKDFDENNKEYHFH